MNELFQSFDNHLKGRTHQLMMDKLEESYKIKVELMRHEQAVAEQQREIELDRMKRQGKRFHMGTQEYCTMCDLTFYGSLVTHRKHERHQAICLSTNYANELGIGKVEYRVSESAFSWREHGKPFRNHPPQFTQARFKPRAPCSRSIAEHKTSVLANYATEA
ncbi:unnamed protein product, partial [Timema podura]|nr:unnamed protein product [Timema podura]